MFKVPNAEKDLGGGGLDFFLVRNLQKEKEKKEQFRLNFNVIAPICLTIQCRALKVGRPSHDGARWHPAGPPGWPLPGS